MTYLNIFDYISMKQNYPQMQSIMRGLVSYGNDCYVWDSDGTMTVRDMVRWQDKLVGLKDNTYEKEMWVATNTEIKSEEEWLNGMFSKLNARDRERLYNIFVSEERYDLWKDCAKFCPKITVMKKL